MNGQCRTDAMYSNLRIYWLQLLIAISSMTCTFVSLRQYYEKKNIEQNTVCRIVSLLIVLV
jgi:hypothetical protein